MCTACPRETAEFRVLLISRVACVKKKEKAHAFAVAELFIKRAGFRTGFVTTFPTFLK